MSWIRLVLNLWPEGSPDTETQCQNTASTREYKLDFPSCLTAHMEPKAEGVINHWEIRCIEATAVLKNHMAPWRPLLKHCVHWQNFSDKQGRTESTHHIATTLSKKMCLCVNLSGIQAYCEPDGWRMLYFFFLKETISLSFSLHVSKQHLWHKEFKGPTEPTCSRWLHMVEVNLQPQQKGDNKLKVVNICKKLTWVLQL